MDTLKPHPRNYRSHPKAQVDGIATALKRWDQYKNLVVWNGFILAGEGVWRGAKAAKLETVEVLDLSHLSESEALALLAWDNESSRGASDDEAALAQIVAEAQKQDAELARLAAGTEARLADLLKEVMPPGRKRAAKPEPLALTCPLCGGSFMP